MPQSGKISITNGNETRFIFIEEIMYFKSDGNYCLVHLENEKPIFLSKSLKEVCQILPPDKYYRIHHGYIINLAYATKFVEDKEDYVVMLDDSKLPVSRRKKTEFLSRFKKL